MTERIIGYRWAIIGLTLLVLSAFAQSDDPSFQILSGAFRETGDEWKDAYNGRDVKKLMQFYSRDVLFISPEAEQPLTVGRDMVIARFQKDMDRNDFIDTLEITSICVTHDHAALICRFRAVREELPYNGSSVLMLKKVGDEWEITVCIKICKKNFMVM